jgi:1,4-dihydroxy-2-naphthoate octaprenyltransferase
MDAMNQTANLPAMSRIDIWKLAIRPKTLPAALAPIVVGLAFALQADRGSWPIAIATMLVALLLQIAANLANDLGDFHRGADEHRLGPPRVTQLGLVDERGMKRGIGVVLGVANLLGGALIARGGWPIALLGVASVLAALAYTAGPYPLAYHGLGEVAVAFFFGGVGVLGTVYLQLGELPATSWVAALAVASHATAILVVNNLRDLATDAAAGKRTVAVRLGERGTLIEYRSLIVLPFLLVVAVALTGWERIGWLAPLVLIPAAWTLMGAVTVTRGPALNKYLGGTAQFALRFAMLLAGGILLERWL